MQSDGNSYCGDVVLESFLTSKLPVGAGSSCLKADAETNKSYKKNILVAWRFSTMFA